MVVFEEQGKTNPNEKEEQKKPKAFLVVGLDYLKSKDINFLLSTSKDGTCNQIQTRNVETINVSDARERNELNEEQSSWGSSK